MNQNGSFTSRSYCYRQWLTATLGGVEWNFRVAKYKDNKEIIIKKRITEAISFSHMKYMLTYEIHVNINKKVQILLETIIIT